MNGFGKNTLFVLSVLVAIAHGSEGESVEVFNPKTAVTPYYAIATVQCSAYPSGGKSWRNAAFAYNSTHLIGVPSILRGGNDSGVTCDNVLNCNPNRPLRITLSSSTHSSITINSSDLDINPKFKVNDYATQNYMFMKAPYYLPTVEFTGDASGGMTVYIPNYVGWNTTSSPQFLTTTIISCDIYSCILPNIEGLDSQALGAPVMITNINKCIGIIAAITNDNHFRVLRITSDGLVALNAPAPGTIVNI